VARLNGYPQKMSAKSGITSLLSASVKNHWTPLRQTWLYLNVWKLWWHDFVFINECEFFYTTYYNVMWRIVREILKERSSFTVRKGKPHRKLKLILQIFDFLTLRKCYFLNIIFILHFDASDLEVKGNKNCIAP